MNQNNYYQKKIYIPQLNNQDKIINKIERWQAHEKGLLHRGFTVILKINNKYLVQNRKHLVFDNVYDLSFSSHPYYKNNQLLKMENCIKESLEREWYFDGKIVNLSFLKKYYYKEKDKNSKYIEHEINYLYLLELDGIIKNNENFCYNFYLYEKNQLLKNYKNNNFAPWIKKIPFSDLNNFLN